MKVTIENKIAGALIFADDVKTAVEISKVTLVRLSSLSSTLYRLVRQGKLVRIPNFGPRGGYGYRLRANDEVIRDLTG